QSSFGYTGNYIKPVVTVKVSVNGKMVTLTNWKDYKVTYSNFKNPGTATITVNGIGQYKGQKSIKFTIRPVDLSKGTATISQSSFGYTGAYIKPVVTVKAKVNGKTVTLTNWKDYKVTYSNFKNPGKATITVTGRGVYSGTLTLTFQIRPSQVKNIKYVGKSTTYVNFKWDKCVGVTGYEVYRATSKNGTYTKVGTVATTTAAFKNTGLKSKTTYYYKVRAYKTVGTTKIYGNYSSIYTIATK
ncbi:MAG: fibronectin type III domain-containing protein, partial [Lachnospiraceae bacterium]|nr:fibronectin type III domain-containing protein [Lachnospiraceae bacterium]